MSIGEILLIVAAVGIMVFMHRVGHGGHAATRPHGGPSDSHAGHGGDSSHAGHGKTSAGPGTTATTVAVRPQGVRGPLRGRDFMLDDQTSGADSDGH